MGRRTFALLAFRFVWKWWNVFPFTLFHSFVLRTFISGGSWLRFRFCFVVFGIIKVLSFKFASASLGSWGLGSHWYPMTTLLCVPVHPGAWHAHLFPSFFLSIFLSFFLCLPLSPVSLQAQNFVRMFLAMGESGTNLFQKRLTGRPNKILWTDLFKQSLRETVSDGYMSLIVGSFQPSHTLMLKFYSYYKQATLGACNIPRPAFWDVVGKAKWWGPNSGRDPEGSSAPPPRIRVLGCLRTSLQTRIIGCPTTKLLIWLWKLGEKNSWQHTGHICRTVPSRCTVSGESSCLGWLCC